MLNTPGSVVPGEGIAGTKSVGDLVELGFVCGPWREPFTDVCPGGSYSRDNGLQVRYSQAVRVWEKAGTPDRWYEAGHTEIWVLFAGHSLCRGKVNHLPDADARISAGIGAWQTAPPDGDVADMVPALRDFARLLLEVRSAETSAGFSGSLRKAMADSMFGRLVLEEFCRTNAAPVSRPALAACLRKHAYKTGEFTLRSGEKVTEYLDVKTALLNPVAGQFIARQVSDAIGDGNVVIAGEGLGGTLLAMRVTALRQARGLIVRTDSKDHGIADPLVGLPDGPVDVWLVEDVVTTGGAVLEALLHLKACPTATVKGVVAVVDRQQGGLAEIAKHYHGITVKALTTLDEICTALA